MSVKTPVGVIFESLKGSWRLKRSLNSVLPGFPSGIFEGTATFSSRTPTTHSVAGELLYAEQGELKMESGLSFKANRKYVYRYNVDEDKISAWFVTEDSKQNEGREEIDYLFHDLEMEQLQDGWVGRGDHLVSNVLWSVSYVFRCWFPLEQCLLVQQYANRFDVSNNMRDPKVPRNAVSAARRMLNA